MSAALSYQLTFCYVALSKVGFRWAGRAGILYMPSSGVSMVFGVRVFDLLPGQIVRVVIHRRAVRPRGSGSDAPVA